MVSLRYKSFVLGIVLTSMTWTIILYMKSKLNKDRYILETDKIAKWKLRPRVLSAGTHSHKEQNIRTNILKKHLIDVETNMIEVNGLAKEDSKKKVQKLLNSTELIHLGMIMSPEDQRVKDQGYKRHAFNLLISDRLGFQRLLPYTAHSL